MTYPIVHLSISYLSIDPSVGWGNFVLKLNFCVLPISYLPILIRGGFVLLDL
jgi:hypothetical protein